ncbi:MAG: NHL repeat-containing protein [Gammaproteobacteria bacterium]|nr:NHL repeat-containing protein [Gammaproteobacteria bacterium]
MKPDLLKLTVTLCIFYWSMASSAQAFDLVYLSASEAVYAHPHDVVLSPDKRFLYVADNGNDRIAVLDPDSLKLLGSFAHGEVNEPHDVVFDAAGRLLVADTGGSRIAIYEVSGTHARLVDELSQSIRRPEGVAVHPNGRVYATGASSDNIVAYDNGRVVAELGGLSGPHDVSVAPNGSLWIADAGNDRLLNVTGDLKIIQMLEGEPYNFSGPRYLDFDDARRLYVADKYNHQIKVLTPDLSMLLTLGGRHSTFGPRYFDRPEGIAIHERQAWFADTYNDRIVRYRIVD